MLAHDLVDSVAISFRQLSIAGAALALTKCCFVLDHHHVQQHAKLRTGQLSRLRYRTRRINK